MKLFNQFVDYGNKKSIGNQWRQKRFKFFEECVKEFKRPLKILDVGGTELFWINRGYANNSSYEIVLVNLYKERTKSSNIKSKIGDATNISIFEENEFDVVFSNSVIEHLYTIENQKKMAEEVRRVGKYYFVQTPNKYFPIEPHHLFPFFQFLPKWIRILILSKTRLIRGKKLELDSAKDKVDEIQLLSRRKLKYLFPTSCIYVEKILFLSKSFVVHNFTNISSNRL